MSRVSTLVTEQHFAYLTDHTRREHPFLTDLKRAAEAHGLPRIWISPEQASYMQILLRLTRAGEVVEVGTLGGYSAIAMAMALPPEGRVRTLELDPEHARFAREWIARSPAADKVEVLEGDARQLLRTLPPDSADAAFIDADKEGYRTYLDESLRIVRRGGLIMADNAFAFGSLFESGERGASVQAIRDFNDYAASRPELHGIIVPLGDGCWTAVKLQDPDSRNDR